MAVEEEGGLCGLVWWVWAGGGGQKRIRSMC